jgi:hypothetical protein
VRTRVSSCIETIIIYIIAALVIFQGMIMFFPTTAVKIALGVVSSNHQRRKRQAELAQAFPAVWVQHIIKAEEKPAVVRRAITGMN